MCMVFLSIFGGCGEHIPDAPDIDEIKRNFQETLDVRIDGQSCPGMSIESLKIEKRKTEDKEDEVYCTFVIRNEEYRIEGQYNCEYEYYDVGDGY